MSDQDAQLHTSFDRQPGLDAESSRFSRHNGLAAVAARDMAYDREPQASAWTTGAKSVPTAYREAASLRARSGNWLTISPEHFPGPEHR